MLFREIVKQVLGEAFTGPPEKLEEMVADFAKRPNITKLMAKTIPPAQEEEVRASLRLTVKSAIHMRQMKQFASATKNN